MSSSQSTALTIDGCSLLTPLDAKARKLIAVSQTGDLQGCKRSVSSSSMNRPSSRS